MRQPGTGRGHAPPDDFAALYHAHFSRLATQFHAYLGDHAEAQDVTQEAFCRALERPATGSAAPSTGSRASRPGAATCSATAPSRAMAGRTNRSSSASVPAPKGRGTG